MTSKTFTHGRFVWRELLTPDAASAQRFYGEMFGWTVRNVPLPGGSYPMVHLRGEEIGGIVEVAAARGVPPSWRGYVSVPDVDAAMKRVLEAGGAITDAPENMPSVGRFVSARDLEKGAFMLFSSLQGDPIPAAAKPGEFCWEQLSAADLPGIEAFYGKVFGWTTAPAPRGGAGGHARLFLRGEDPTTIENLAASVMPASPGAPSQWLSHVCVEDLPASRARALRLGGRVLNEHVDVPGVGAYAVVQDPQGAILAMFEHRRPVSR